MSNFSELKIEGRVATPGDADWDEARLAWNLAADLRPSAVAFVESAEDVAKTVRFAAENGLRVSGQGTGHGAIAVLGDVMLIGCYHPSQQNTFTGRLTPEMLDDVFSRVRERSQI